MDGAPRRATSTATAPPTATTSATGYQSILNTQAAGSGGSATPAETPGLEARKSTLKAAKLFNASSQELDQLGLTSGDVGQPDIGPAVGPPEPEVRFIGPSAAVYIDEGKIFLLRTGQTFASKVEVKGFNEANPVAG